MIDAGRFLEAGGYDEGIFLYQEEDVLGWKMRTMGLRTVLLLDRSYDHAHSVSISKSFSGQMERQRLREQSVFYYMKNYLHISRIQEWFARVWFWGIWMEIRTAQIFSQKENNKAGHKQGGDMIWDGEYIDKFKRNLRRYGCFLLCMMIFSLLPMRASAEEQEHAGEKTDSKVVRVGWYEDSYHITGVNGGRSGYAYEYEQAVAGYTDGSTSI